MQLIVRPSRIGLIFGLILNCALVLMPIAFGWRHFVTTNVSEKIGLSVLGCMLLPILPIALGWYRLVVRDVIVLRPRTIELRTDFRLFQSIDVLELNLVKNVSQKGIYVPRWGGCTKIVIDYDPRLDGPVYFGENLSQEEAAYIVMTINAYRGLGNGHRTGPVSRNRFQPE